MTHVIAADTSKVIHESTVIKENIMKIVEQLEKQDNLDPRAGCIRPRAVISEI